MEDRLKEICDFLFVMFYLLFGIEHRARGYRRIHRERAKIKNHKSQIKNHKSPSIDLPSSIFNPRSFTRGS